MKSKILIIVGFLLWTTCSFAQIKRLEDAKNQAKQENKFILLKFTGSDWCIPCMQLQENIINNSHFVDFAKDKLVILLADFPRHKKNQPSKADQKDNEQLAEIYNPDGVFPQMVLLDSKGKVLYRWSGYDKKHSVQDYIDDINRSSK